MSLIGAAALETLNLLRPEALELARSRAQDPAFVRALQELFQSQAIFGDLAKHWQLPLGLTIIVCVATMPKGLVGLLNRKEPA